MADKRQKRLAEFIEPFRVKPGTKVRLGKDFDPAFKAGVTRKKEGVALLKGGVQTLAEYQARLAAQDSWGVLVVLQAMDTAGKDGTIRHVMSGVNPQGVAVHSFKVPSAEELDHDFLWRYAQRLPARGEIGIFNRSHYEEVIVVRVHPENLDHERLPSAAKKGDVWQRRYRAINDWERYLSENGFRIVKLFLTRRAHRHDLHGFVVRLAHRAGDRWQRRDDRDRRRKCRGRVLPGIPGQHERVAHRGRRASRGQDPAHRNRRSGGDRADARTRAGAAEEPRKPDARRRRHRRIAVAGRRARNRAPMAATPRRVPALESPRSSASRCSESSRASRSRSRSRSSTSSVEPGGRTRPH